MHMFEEDEEASDFVCSNGENEIANLQRDSEWKGGIMGANPTCVARSMGVGIYQSSSQFVRWKLAFSPIVIAPIVPDYTMPTFEQRGCSHTPCSIVTCTFSNCRCSHCTQLRSANLWAKKFFTNTTTVVSPWTLCFHPRPFWQRSPWSASRLP